MAHMFPDFEDLYLNEWMSDVTIAINEEDLSLIEKRGPVMLFPGHGLILMGFSSYCKAKLTNLVFDVEAVVPTEPAKKQNPQHNLPEPIIELTVPAGQAELAIRLVKGIYQKQPDCSDLSQEQLLQLAMLADRFGVPKMVAAALEPLKSLSLDQMEWQTAVEVLDLPDSCTQQEILKDLRERTMTKVWQQLGDLDRVWVFHHHMLQQQLLALPHAVLLQLLQHDDTCAEDEATVVHTIEQWWLNQARRACSLDPLCQLLQQVRMRHVRQDYISAVMMHCGRQGGLLKLCYTPEELGVACMCASEDALAILQQAGCPELTKYPAWTAAKRPSTEFWLRWVPLWHILHAATP